jgi:hypothetical protein
MFCIYSQDGFDQLYKRILTRVTSCIYRRLRIRKSHQEI